MIRAILFDMDGLMFDTGRPYLELIYKISKEHGYSLNKEEVLWFNGISSHRISEFESKYPGISKVMDEVNARFDDYFYDMYPKPGAANKKGLKELYLYLKQNGYKIAVASGSREQHIRNLLSYCGFDFEPDLIISSYEGIPSKPCPDIFLEAAKQLLVQPEECLVLEDSRSGTLAARNANMRCVTIFDLEKFNDSIDMVANDLEKVVPILKFL